MSILRTLRGVLKEEMMENRGVKGDVVGKSVFDMAQAALVPSYFRSFKPSTGLVLFWFSIAKQTVLIFERLSTRQDASKIPSRPDWLLAETSRTAASKVESRIAKPDVRDLDR